MYVISACGACYVFAANAAIEYSAAIAGKFLLASEQDPIDCDTKSFGCDGKIWKFK